MACSDSWVSDAPAMGHEDLARPHVVDAALDEGYRAMAYDKARETEAMEWCNAFSFAAA